MNRLWVRLSLYFGGVVLLGALLIGGAARIIVTDTVRQALLPAQLRAPGGIVDTLADYYRRHQSWTGVDDLITGMRVTAPLWSGRLDLTLVDKNGQPVYRNRAGGVRTLGNRVAMPIPILVDNVQVGELQLALRPAELRNLVVRGPLEQLSRYLLLVAVIGGSLGIVFSVLASRNLTEPLARLASAARDIGARKFSHRVTATGSDEIIAVAQAFNDMAAELENAETLRRNLVADVAHELRTPLSVLQGNLRAILDDLYPLDKAEIARLYTQTRLLNRLVNDLHELAQADAGQLSLNLQPIDLNQLIEETVSAHAPVAEDAEVNLQVDLAPKLPLISGDATRLSQVLHNLLANALRHTPAAGQIQLQTQVQENNVVLTVKDNGEGIASEHLAHLFDRFYRTDQARARDKGGVGLGLAIVRALVAAQGGQVRVESEGVGLGSTFVVTLPLSQEQTIDE